MVQYFIKQAGKLVVIDAPQANCWINITPPIDMKELEMLSETFEVPLDFFTDPLDADERARYEREEDARLILLNSAIHTDSDSENEAIYITVPLGIILVSDIVMTISAVENPIIELLLGQKVRNFDPSDEKQVVLQLMNLNIQRFLLCLRKLNIKRNLTEQELHASTRSNDLKQLLRIQKSLVYFVNSLSANELLKMKIKRTNFLGINGDEDKMDFFEDIIIDSSQALEMANVHTNILNSTMGSYSTIISNNLNEVIQRLTLITIIIAIPTLLSSFYGMNVPVPLGESPYAFFIILVFAALVAGVMVLFLRRNQLF